MIINFTIQYIIAIMITIIFLPTLLYHLIILKTTDFKQKAAYKKILFNLYTALYYIYFQRISSYQLIR